MRANYGDSVNKFNQIVTREKCYLLFIFNIRSDLLLAFSLIRLRRQHRTRRLPPPRAPL